MQAGYATTTASVPVPLPVRLPTSFLKFEPKFFDETWAHLYARRTKLSKRAQFFLNCYILTNRREQISAEFSHTVSTKQQKNEPTVQSPNSTGHKMKVVSVMCEKKQVKRHTKDKHTMEMQLR